jgi:MarR family transcriptional regulator, transcriptional regulator for hemolysin
MKTPKRTAENINFMFSQTSNAMRVYIDKEMEDLGLTRAQWIVLSLLYSVNGSNHQELATHLGIGKGTLGKLVRKLENKGWLRRQANENDGRVINLFITDQALPMVKQLVELLFEESRRSLAGISQEEITLMRSLMNRIKDNIDHMPPSKKWSKIKQDLTRDIKLLDA